MKRKPLRSVGIVFDRAVAKGHFTFALIVALCILIFPLLMFTFQSRIIHLLSANGLMSDQNLKSLMEAYELYLNPSFGGFVSNPERGYRLFLGYLGAFLLNGLLVSLVVSFFQNRRERWERGDLRYSKDALKNFAVVIGGNEMVPDLVGQLLDSKPLNYVLIMTNGDVAALRKKIVSAIGQKREERIIIYYGDLTSADDLKHLKLHCTKNDIYIIGEQLDTEQRGSHHDVMNMDCVQKIAGLLKEYGKKKTCRVMFEYQSTFSVFQFADVNNVISEFIDFKPFNYYETWAQKVLVCKELNLVKNKVDYLPLEGAKPITKDDEDAVHLIVVGMSRMGIAMAVEAAHLAHYPNYITKNRRTRITFIDSQAYKEMNFVQGHYRDLFAVSRWRYMEVKPMEDFSETIATTMWNDARHTHPNSPYKDEDGYSLGEKLVDIDWQFIGGDLEMPGVQEFIRREAVKENIRITIAICFPQDNASLAASLYLPDEIYEEKSNVVQVLVYQPHGDAMRKSFVDDSADLNKSFKLFAKLRAFGMMNKCYSVAGQEELEKISDSFGKDYEEASKTKESERSIICEPQRMTAQKAGKTPAAKQWSSYYAASHMWTKLRSAGYDGISFALDEEDVFLLSQVEHMRWNMEQLLMGYAPLKKEEQLPIINTPDARNRFIETKERLKANMSHVDICSLDVLEKVDKDALKYDVVQVRKMPLLYLHLYSIINEQTENEN